MTYYPSRSEFRTLAKTWRIIPVWREVLADLTTPVAAYYRVVGDGEGFLLESVDHGGQWSRWSFVGRNPIAKLVSRGLDVSVIGDLGIDVPLDKGILAALDEVVEYYQSPPIGDLPPLHSGLVGYLGYDIVREVEYLPDMSPDDSDYPDALIAMIGDLAVYDHWSQKATLISNVVVPDGMGNGLNDSELDKLYDEAVARVDAVAMDGAKSLEEPLLAPIGLAQKMGVTTSDTASGIETKSDVGVARLDIADLDFTSTLGLDRYTQAIHAAKEYMYAGDIFQVVLSQRFSFDLKADAFDVYRTLRQVNPSPYMYYLNLDGVKVVGGSPEPMVKLIDGKIITRPTAGSRWRGKTPEEDERLAEELVNDTKDRAEHVMLVDLQRNDLGRVIEFGTLNVDEFMAVKRFSHVMHLTSQVTGHLAIKASAIDVLRATLPAGTVSGAPKVRAMEIIDELEPVKRTPPYAGLVGYIDFSGNMDTALGIRTMIVRDGQAASVQAGAGILVDSVPLSEHRECVNKASALMIAALAAEKIQEARNCTGS